MEARRLGPVRIQRVDALGLRRGRRFGRRWRSGAGSCAHAPDACTGSTTTSAHAGSRSSSGANASSCTNSVAYAGAHTDSRSASGTDAGANSGSRSASGTDARAYSGTDARAYSGTDSCAGPGSVAATTRSASAAAADVFGLGVLDGASSEHRWDISNRRERISRLLRPESVESCVVRSRVRSRQHERDHHWPRCRYLLLLGRDTELDGNAKRPIKCGIEERSVVPGQDRRRREPSYCASTSP
jgi:hypothetical protein